MTQDLHLRTNGSPPVVRWPMQPVPVAPRYTWGERLLLVACLLVAVAFLFIFLTALALGLRDITIAAFRLLPGGH